MKLILYTWDVGRKNKETNKEEEKGVNKEEAREGERTKE
jgi:hypothetical protein